MPATTNKRLNREWSYLDLVEFSKKYFLEKNNYTIFLMKNTVCTDHLFSWKYILLS